MNNQEEAHRFFSGHLFNEVWELLEKTERTTKQNELMREMAHASLFHWLMRGDDCTDQKRSIGYWQVSRVYAVTNDGVTAKRYAQQCLRCSLEQEAFLLGYAHEAMARAYFALDDHPKMHEHAEKARELCEQVSDQEDKAYLSKDLEFFGQIPKV